MWSAIGFLVHQYGLAKARNALAVSPSVNKQISSRLRRPHYNAHRQQLTTEMSLCANYPVGQIQQQLGAVQQQLVTIQQETVRTNAK